MQYMRERGFLVVSLFCFHCILRGRVSKSGSSGEIGEGVLIKIVYSGFGNKKPLGLASILTDLSLLITLIPQRNKRTNSMTRIQKIIRTEDLQELLTVIFLRE